MAKYDFREGLEKEKIIYVNKFWDWRSFLSYIGYMLFTWGFVVGWFILFQYAFINHPLISVWVYGFCWLTFIIITVTILISNLVKHRNAKMRKKREAQRLETVLEMQNLASNNLEGEDRVGGIDNNIIVENLDGV
jgi:hypothetical protein